MTLRQYLFLMFLGTLLCWGIWVFIILTIDPTSADTISLMFFYASLFLSLVGTIFIITFSLRRLFNKNDDIVFRSVRRTFRQSMVLSTFIIFALLLLQKHLLNYWNTILLVVLFLLLESIVFASRKHNNEDYVR